MKQPEIQLPIGWTWEQNFKFNTSKIVWFARRGNDSVWCVGLEICENCLSTTVPDVVKIAVLKVNT
jgi:hypothetical protein